MRRGEDWWGVFRLVAPQEGEWVVVGSGDPLAEGLFVEKVENEDFVLVNAETDERHHVQVFRIEAFPWQTDPDATSDPD